MSPEPGEVLVSSTVKDLVAGSGLVFEKEAQHRALVDQLRIEIEKGTDDRAAGTITNTAD